MASFTDKTPQFNPYIQQLPVDAMVKVGMEKQQQYNEGVQKIQTQIDNVAGLDVMRDVDKQHLQSRLNSLGNNLKTVAAGDFSNTQLVNSLGGMTNQIVKDPIIQNAVYSTQKVRTEQQNMRDAQKAGKSSPSNDWLLDQNIGDYINDPNPKRTFNGKYEQAVDTNKPLLDAITAAHADKLGEDENIIQTDAKGNRTINQDLLQHKLREGLSTSKVIAIARNVYSRPDLARQLQIDGLYNYKDYTPDQLVSDRVAATNYQKAQIFNENPSLRAYSTLAEGDVKLKADKNLQYNYDQLKSLDSQLSDFTRLVGSNFNSAKADSYMRNKLQEVGNQYAWKSEDTKTEVSPQFTVNMDRDRLLLSKAEFTERKRMDNASIANIASEIGERTANAEIAKAKLSGKLDASGNAIWTPQDAGVNSAQAAKVNSASFQKSIDNNVALRTSLFQEVTAGLGVEYNGQVYNDLYKRDDATGGMILNPKYVNTPLGTALQKAAASQLNSKIDATGQIHLNGDAAKIYGDKIKQWYDLGTLVNKQNEAKAQIESQYKPIYDKILNNPELSSKYEFDMSVPGNTIDNMLAGNFRGNHVHVTLTKDQLKDIAVYSQNKHFFKDDENISKQAYQNLQNSFGDNTDRIINAVTVNREQIYSPYAIGSGNDSPVAKDYNKIKDILQKEITPEMIQNREKSYQDLQRQAMTPDLTLTSSDPKKREEINEIIRGELLTVMGNKSSGQYKNAAGFIEKLKLDPDALENNVIKVRQDPSGDWFLKLSNLKGGEFNVNTPDIKLDKGTVQKLQLQNQIDPNEVIFKNSTIGKILDMNRGYSTSSSTTNNLHSDEAYNSALERKNVGNYSVGLQVQATDLNNSEYVPYLYIGDKATGERYKAIPLDWSKLATLKGLDSTTKQHLLSQSVTYKRRDLIPGIEEFKSILGQLPNPDEAVKLLIGNIDKQ